MSQKASAEMVESNFEQFAENAGWETSELAEHVHEVFGEDDGDNLMDGVSFEGSDESETDESESETSDNTEIAFEDMEYKDLQKLAGEKLESYPEDRSKDGLVEALKGNVKAEDMTEDTEDTEDTSEGWNQPAFDNPNPKSFYDHPEAIMSENEITTHSGFQDLNIDVVKLQHKQGVHGICEACNLAYAGAGSKCAKCKNDGNKASNGSNGSNGESDKSLMSSLIQNPNNDINTVSQAEEEIAKME